MLVDGSGKKFQFYLQQYINNKSLTPMLSENSKFSHDEKIEKTDAIQEAKKLGADYALVTVLGYVRDAPPLTIMQHYVYIASGSLYRVNDEKEIWAITGFRLGDSDVDRHRYNRLLNRLAKIVVTDITR